MLIDAALVGALVIVPGIAIGRRPTGGVPGVIAGIGLLVLFTLTLASDVFVAPQTMPDWLRAIVRGNPVSHLITAERGLRGGRAAASQVAWVLIAAAIITAVFVPLPVWLCGRPR